VLYPRDGPRTTDVRKRAPRQASLPPALPWAAANLGEIPVRHFFPKSPRTSCRPGLFPPPPPPPPTASIPTATPTTRASWPKSLPDLWLDIPTLDKMGMFLNMAARGNQVFDLAEVRNRFGRAATASQPTDPFRKGLPPPRPELWLLFDLTEEYAPLITSTANDQSGKNGWSKDEKRRTSLRESPSRTWSTSSTFNHSRSQACVACPYA